MQERLSLVFDMPEQNRDIAAEVRSLIAQWERAQVTCQQPAVCFLDAVPVYD